MKVAENKHIELAHELHERKISKFRKDTVKEKIRSRSYEGITEHGIIDYSINKVFKDISTGDIFKIKKDGEDEYKYGVIVNASCDLPVRFNEKLSEGSNRKDSDIILALYMDLKYFQKIVK